MRSITHHNSKLDEHYSIHNDYFTTKLFNSDYMLATLWLLGNITNPRNVVTFEPTSRHFYLSLRHQTSGRWSTTDFDGRAIDCQSHVAHRLQRRQSRTESLLAQLQMGTPTSPNPIHRDQNNPLVRLRQTRTGNLQPPQRWQRRSQVHNGTALVRHHATQCARTRDLLPAQTHQAYQHPSAASCNGHPVPSGHGPGLPWPWNLQRAGRSAGEYWLLHGEAVCYPDGGQPWSGNLQSEEWIWLPETFDWASPPRGLQADYSGCWCLQSAKSGVCGTEVHYGKEVLSAPGYEAWASVVEDLAAQQSYTRCVHGTETELGMTCITTH